VFAEWLAIEYSLSMPICPKISIHLTAPLGQRRSFLSSTSLRLTFLHLRLWTIILFAALAFSSTIVAFAQDSLPQQAPPGATSSGQPPAAPTPPQQQPPNAPSKVPGVALYNLLQEKSIVFPDIALNTERLDAGGKFQLFVDNSISVHTLTWAMLGAAVGQANDSPTGFGEGWDAYAKRFGTSMGRQASAEFFGTFVLASALHEDPRFYAEINPSFMHAVKYSVQRVFITRHDDGRDVANLSGLIGPAMGEGLANVYWPDRNRTVGDTLFRYGLDLASKAGGNMLREYWPVFYGKVHRGSRPSAGH
jgi:hypothetical protein